MTRLKEAKLWTTGIK